MLRGPSLTPLAALAALCMTTSAKIVRRLIAAESSHLTGPRTLRDE
jgi:hypothetical protein